MKDYSAMSDKEINQRITAVVNGCENWCLSDDESCFYDCGVDGNQFYEVKIKDYCNNPSDMWPLIVDNKMDICHIDSHGVWKAFAIKDSEIVSHEDKNPLRAAAIVFLMLNEDK